MTTIPCNRLGAPLAERHAEAVRQLLRFQPFDQVRQALRLNRAEERRAIEHMRAAYPWIAVIIIGPEEDEDLGLCPGLAPHPAVPLPSRTKLLWCADSPGEGRVVAHTCMCQMTSYELLSNGGLYRIRRDTLPRPGVPAVSCASGWRRPEAGQWWQRLLLGHAR
ncbi:hypothetical protein AB0B54_19945 [Microbispora bryophytorum]|uniref:hypothetical protein n=1 Tax=Microbispora bryophytorum TaxID=1460882 RepID=UPI0033DA2428